MRLALQRAEPALISILFAPELQGGNETRIESAAMVD
jgi:hypothetical protein